MITIKEIESLHTEGSRAIEDLAKMAEGLGYGEGFGQMQLNNSCYVSSLLDMLQDNPGMVEAMHQFVLDHESSYDELVDEEDDPEEDEEDRDLPMSDVMGDCDAD